MKQLTLNIPEEKLPFFIELIQNFDFIDVEESEDDLAVILECNKRSR